MKFYLQSVSPEDFMEINQAITLSGVLTEPWQFTRGEIEPQQAVSSLLEVMSEEQTVLVTAISSGFRSMLEEGKRLQSLSKQLILNVPCAEQGLMCLKAAIRLQLPVAAGMIFQSEQAVLAARNQARMIVLDLEKIGRFGSSKKVLEDTLSMLEEEARGRVLAQCSSLEQLRMAMKAGAKNLCAPVDVYHQMLFCVPTVSEAESIREEWVLTFTRNEVLE